MPTRADPLASARWDARPLVVVAPPDDPRIAEQRERIAEAASGFRERDQMLVEARDGDGLRERFRVAPDAFAVILVGKDGTEKARWPEPVDAAEVFALIDAMPMRRREIERGD